MYLRGELFMCSLAHKQFTTQVDTSFYINSYIFIQENGFETVFCEMAAILSRHVLMTGPALSVDAYTTIPVPVP